jgi:serine-type D-Ala-D-Ala carboxypeptidase (penicillin-binding protein 5/6)
MRQKILSIFCIVIILFSAIYVLIAYRKPAPALTASITSADSSNVANPAIEWPKNGEAAIGATGYGVLAENGPQLASPTASAAKIMTALAVLKEYPLSLGDQGPVLTMTTTDVSSFGTYLNEDGSVTKVVVGEKLTEYQALEAMLLPSSDNMADTLARWAYGSIAAYSAAANSMAHDLGMNSSKFGTADASGYSPETVSTAHDLVLLGQAGLNNSVIAQIVSKSQANIPVSGTINNVNWLLGYDGINGIKTGNTDQAGGVFIFSAVKHFANGQSVTIVGSVMQPRSTLFQALFSAIPILKSAESNFTVSSVIQKGDIVANYNVPWGTKVSASAAESISTISWKGQNTAPIIKLKPINTPVSVGAKVGVASFRFNNLTVPIILNQSIKAPTWNWRLHHVF